MAWWVIAIFIVSLVIAVAFSPKPMQGNQKPAGLDEVQAPTAEVGREIAVLFGTRDINGPNCTWYGVLMTRAIKDKAGKK